VQGYQLALDQGQLPTVCGLHAGHVDQLQRLLCERLLCTFELNFDALALHSGVDARQHYARHWPALRQLHLDGVIVLSDDGLVIPPHARLLVAAVCAAFEQPSARYMGHSVGSGGRR
jgi:oxygen-independent coproporphyrinogen-3 oxidase